MKTIKENLIFNGIPAICFPVKPQSSTNDIYIIPNWHPQFELILIEHGSGYAHLDGEKFRVEKNDIFAVGSNQIHSFYSDTDKQCIVWVFQFNIDDFELLNEIKFTKKISKSNPLWSCVHKILVDIKEICISSSPYMAFELKALLYKLLVIFVKNKELFGIDSSHNNFSSDIIQSAFAFVDKHYTENVTIKDVSRYVNLSVPHFMRVFKSATTVTFKYFLNLYRVNASIKLLGTELLISEISKKCGFDNVNTYIRLFKKHRGITPEKFRKLLKK